MIGKFTLIKTNIKHTMYDKILAQLLVRNPGVSKIVLGLLADKMASKITEENQIEGVIKEYENNSLISVAEYAALVQKEGDKRVSDALKKVKKDIIITDPVNGRSEKGNPIDMQRQIEDAIALTIKPFREMFLTNKEQQTKESLRALLKDKGVPENWADDVYIGKTFDMEATAAYLENKWNKAKARAIHKIAANGTDLKLTKGIKKRIGKGNVFIVIAGTNHTPDLERYCRDLITTESIKANNEFIKR